MTRWLTTVLLLVASLLASRPAGAQLSVDLWSRECSTSERDELEDGINLEECEGNCYWTFRLSYSGSLGAGDLYIYIGAGCESKENRDEGRCFAAYENRPLETLSNYEIEPAWVVDPQGEPPSCVEGEGANDIFFLVLGRDANETVVYQQVVTVSYDTQRPEPPVDVSAGYGEGMITVRWDVAEPDFPEEWQHFYVMCWGEGMPVAEPAEPAPDASTDPAADPAGDLVDETDDVADDLVDEELDAWDVTDPVDPGVDPGTEPASDSAGPDGSGEDCPSGGFNEGDDFDEAYACSDRLGSSTRRFDLRGLENNQPYKVSVVAVDEFGNKSAIGPVMCATPQEVDDFWEVYKKAGGGDEGGFCFVATAAFGDREHPAVRWLRAFRDEVLAPTAAGRMLVAWYYGASPRAASWLERHDRVRALARAALWPVAGAARLAVAGTRHPLAVLGLVLAACLAAAALRLRRRGSA